MATAIGRRYNEGVIPEGAFGKCSEDRELSCPGQNAAALGSFFPRAAEMICRLNLGRPAETHAAEADQAESTESEHAEGRWLGN